MGPEEQVNAAYETNDTIARAFWAILDGDADAVREHPDITVYADEDDADEIASIEYDGSGVLDWQGSEARNEIEKAFDAWPSEVTVGWGRPLVILLSGGGPTEWIEAKFDSDGDVSEATLYASHNDWNRAWKLNNRSALYRVAEHYAEMNQQPEQ